MKQFRSWPPLPPTRVDGPRLGRKLSWDSTWVLLESIHPGSHQPLNCFHGVQVNCQYIIASKLIVTIYGYSVLFTILKGELITPSLIFSWSICWHILTYLRELEARANVCPPQTQGQSLGQGWHGFFWRESPYRRFLPPELQGHHKMFDWGRLQNPGTCQWLARDDVRCMLQLYTNVQCSFCCSVWKVAAWGCGKDLMTKNTSLQAVLLIVVGLLFLVWGFLCGQRFGTGEIAAPPSILFPESRPNLASTLKYRTNSWFWDGLHNWMDVIEGWSGINVVHCTLYTCWFFYGFLITQVV